MAGTDTTPLTEKQTAGKRIGEGKPGPGRKKGVPNKTTTLLKDSLIEAATKAGGKDGLVGYLKKQAEESPRSFLPLLGKVLPLQLSGLDDDGKPTPLIIRLEGVMP